MRYIKVEQTSALRGSVQISGSKNSSLALLAASCLADDIVRLEGIPDIEDVKVISKEIPNRKQRTITNTK